MSKGAYNPMGLSLKAALGIVKKFMKSQDINTMIIFLDSSDEVQCRTTSRKVNEIKASEMKDMTAEQKQLPAPEKK